MLQKMRENTKIILWIVVITFVVTIFAVWGLDLQTGTPGTDPNVIGRINGVAISVDQYRFAYQRLADQLRSSNQNQPLTSAQEEYVRGQAWDTIVYGILTEQEIARLGITVNDQEIVDYLRGSPPAEIRQYFVDENGNFDNQAYQAALNNPEVDWTSLEQLARERIPRIKLNEYLAAQVHVSEDEVRREYEMTTVDLSIAWVEFSISDADIGDYSPTDEEIEESYWENQNDFVEREKRRIEVVRIPYAPSSADVRDVVYTIQRLREQILAGEEFAVLAKSFSEASSAFAGGGTGFMAMDQRDSLYFAALDQLEPGELSGPVTTDEGTYLLRFLGKQTGKSGNPEYNAEEILISPTVSRQTSDSLFTYAEELRNRATKVGLVEAAAEKQLEVLSPGPFPDKSYIEGVGFVPPLSRFAFGSAVGAVSEVVQDDENIYVARLTEQIDEQLKPLESVRSLITSRILLEKRKEVTHRDASAFHHKARATDFDTAVKTYGLAKKESGDFRAGENLDPFGSRSVIVEAALAVSPGQTTAPIEWRNSYVVVQVIKRSEIDSNDYRTQIVTIKQRILGQKTQLYAESWYENLKAQSDIEDYRTQG